MLFFFLGYFFTLFPTIAGTTGSQTISNLSGTTGSVVIISNLSTTSQHIAINSSSFTLLTIITIFYLFNVTIFMLFDFLAAKKPKPLGDFSQLE